jgi:hypothetical protein
MKVTFCQSVDVEGEAIISVEDISIAMRKHIEEVESFKTSPSDKLTIGKKQTIRMTSTFASEAIQLLQAIPEDMIAAMPEGSRLLAVKLLKEQASRWDLKDSADAINQPPTQP